MSAITEDTCMSSSSIESLGFDAVLASVRRLAAEHNITDERAILAEARDRWRRERPIEPEQQ